MLDVQLVGKCNKTSIYLIVIYIVIYRVILYLFR